MKDLPLVSYCIAVYNAKDYIDECLASLLNQTYKNIEIILVDDCSTDGTYEHIRDNYRNVDSIRLERNDKNNGIAYTVNRALEVAKGEFIARMDSDDICSLDRTELQVNKLLECDADICIGSVEFFGDGYNRIWNCISDNNSLKMALSFNCPVCNSTSIFSRSVLDKVGYYSNESHTEDYNYWIRASEEGFNFVGVNNIVLYSRQHSGSFTRNKKQLVLDSAERDRHRALKNLNFGLDDCEIDLLSRGLSGTNKLNKDEFLRFTKLYFDLFKHCDFIDKEAIDFVKHNWLSVGLNNMNLGLKSYFSWLSFTELTSNLSLLTKIKLFLCFSIKLDSSGKLYQVLKSFGK